ncbi:MAG: TIR domain-containing protein [Oscillospiraceae bacterium]|nr:TIR domain-containing protein [Oscillospiraceae bacterium]
MAIIKCKMCGGDIELSADKTFGTCEYCGSTMTLPKIDDEQRAAAFNRGNHFRRIGEFDKALAVYERIVQEDENDAEAHWCCALCRFGIEYVEDPNTYEYLPTCHRASFDSFLEDVDYLAALEHSDGITKRQYQRDAAKIADVQRGILATSQKEEPFDVFICYKETDDETKERTRDSLDAQEIYYNLTQEGYRVFFSRITLEDKAGAEYEPYIFAALNSAKVMVCVGSKPEYFNAVWVKNEWSRFLSLMKKDRSKLLLPCYKNMDPYDLPEQLSVLQSYDMSKIGFMQDLVRGIGKVLRAQEKPVETVKETVVVHNEGGANANVTALLKRGNQALEDGEYKKADEFFDRVLDIDAECAEAFLGKFLADNGVASLSEYEEQCEPNLKPKGMHAVEADIKRVDSIVSKYEIKKYLSSDTIRSMLEFRDFSFSSSANSAKEEYEAQVERFEDKNFKRAEKYAQGELKNKIEKIRQRILDKFKSCIRESEEHDVAEIARIKDEYKNFLDSKENEIKRLHDEAEKREQSDAKRSKKRNKIIGIVAGIAVFAVAAYFVVTLVIIPMNKYNHAQELFEAGDYDSAIAAFTELGDYKDSAEKVFEVKYADATDLFSRGNYTGAIALFSELGYYKDSAEKVLEVWDKLAYRETISAGGVHSIGLKLNGTLVSAGSNGNDRNNIGDWSDMVAISAGRAHNVGLKKGKTVMAIGNNDDGYGWIFYVKDDSHNIKFKGKFYNVGNDYSIFEKNNYFIKDYPWEYEREFRLVFDLTNAENKYGKLTFDKIIIKFNPKDISLMFAPEIINKSQVLEQTGFKKYLATLIDDSKLDISMGLLGKDIEGIINSLSNALDKCEDKKRYTPSLEKILNRLKAEDSENA